MQTVLESQIQGKTNPKLTVLDLLERLENQAPSFVTKYRQIKGK